MESNIGKYHWIWWTDSRNARCCIQASKCSAFKPYHCIEGSRQIFIQNNMENKLINCEGEVNSSESQHLANCASLVFFGESGGSSYISVGPGDGGAALSSGESTFGKPLAYPSEWKPSADFYDSRSLKVASCLVVQGSLSIVEMSNSMGCSTPDHSEPALPANQTSGKTTEVLAW